MVLESKEDGMVLRTSEHVPDVIKQILLERGWNEFEEDSATSKGSSWNLWWKTQRFRKSEHNEIEPWQRLNHFPRTDAITRKDSLVRNFRRMKCVHGAQAFSFHPTAYILPNEYTKFVSDYAKESQKHGKKNLYWICKPVDLSRGRGIFIFNDLKHLTYDCSVVVQKYIANPLLISGYKFDLRIYVCVPSFQPLTIYTYQEGIARFSTDKFDLSQLNNVFSHLTNTSINKYGPSYATDKERVGPGCKWTLSQLRSFLRQMEDFDEALLWMRISNIIALTLATQAPTVPKCQNCFELFGFDILVDDQMKPWLLEVNFSPALSMDCQADFIAKRSMLNDLVDLLNFKDTDSEHGGQTPREPPVNYSPALCRSRSLYDGPQVFDPKMFSDTDGQVGNTISRRTSAPTRTKLKSPLNHKSPGTLQGKQVSRTPRTSSRSEKRSSATSVAKATGHEDISSKSLTRNTSSSSLTSSVSSVDHCNQLENTPDSESTINESLCESSTRSSSVPPGGESSIKDQHPKKRRNNPLAPIRESNSSMRLDASTGPLFNHLSVKHMPVHSGSPRLTKKKKSLNSAPYRTTQAYSSKTNDLDKLSGNQSRSRKLNSEYKSPYSVKSTAPKKVSQASLWPKTRVGDFILTFPLNEAMRKASGQMFDMKVIIREQQKMIKKLNESSLKRVEEHRRSSTDLSNTDAMRLKFQLMFDDKDANPHYFWGPQNPPLLASVFS